MRKEKEKRGSVNCDIIINPHMYIYTPIEIGHVAVGVVLANLKCLSLKI